jgi:hypothetical protein
MSAPLAVFLSVVVVSIAAVAVAGGSLWAVMALLVIAALTISGSLP